MHEVLLSVELGEERGSAFLLKRSLHGVEAFLPGLLEPPQVVQDGVLVGGLTVPRGVRWGVAHRRVSRSAARSASPVGQAHRELHAVQVLVWSRSWRYSAGGAGVGSVSVTGVVPSGRVVGRSGGTSGRGSR